MISIAGMAQQKPISSSDYNKDKIEQAADSSYHDADTTLNQGIDRAGQRLENQADETGNDLRQGAEKIDQGVERTGDELQEGAQKVGTETKEGVQRAGQEVEQAGDRVMNEMDTTGTGSTSSGENDSVQTEQPAEGDMNRTDTTGTGATSSVENKTDSQQAVNATESGEPQPKVYHDVTVVEDKEGPNGEVVYKFNDGHYYVDRTKEKKLIKIEESELKDIKHKVIVKTGGKKSGKGTKSSAQKSSTMKSKS